MGDIIILYSQYNANYFAGIVDLRNWFISLLGVVCMYVGLIKERNSLVFNNSPRPGQSTMTNGAGGCYDGSIKFPKVFPDY